MAVGLLVPAEKVSAVLSARIELRGGAEAAAAGAEEAEGQQRWHASLREAMDTQRRLQASPSQSHPSLASPPYPPWRMHASSPQLALPAHSTSSSSPAHPPLASPSTIAWQLALPAHDDDQSEGALLGRCWAELQQHEGADLDTDEREEAQRKQADIRSFQLEMQRRKKQKARDLAMGATRKGGDGGGGRTSPPPAHIAEAATPSVAAPKAFLPNVAPKAFLPKPRKVVRNSAADVRAAAQSKLHPLLQKAGTPEDGGKEGP